jgi:phosphate transport system substrate-binding protein
MKIKALHTTLTFFVLAVICLTSTSVSGKQLVILGTSASEVILQELATAFNAENPGSEVVIPPSVGSGGGINLVASEENMLGRVARPLKKSEQDHGLKHLVFAKDMIVFAVGSKVGVANLSSQQLADLYSGKVSNWKEVGGNDTRVRLLVRNPEDSAYGIIKHHLKPFQGIEFSPKAKVMFHDYDQVNALNKFSSAIGWISHSTLKIVDPSVKPIAIDGIAPTQQNVYDGKYALAFEYALVYKEGQLRGLARKFVEYIFSKEGNRVLVGEGLVPANDQKF